MSPSEINNMAAGIWEPVFGMIGNWVWSIISVVLIIIGVAIVLFFACCRINPFRLSPEYLENLPVKWLPYDLLRWYLYDALSAKNREKTFAPYGFTIFCGPQGAGKTIGMVKYCYDLKQKYPDCILVTNFACSFADQQMQGWKDFMTIRNDTDGVIFAIDEIHSEFACQDWANFPPAILSEISQQRKQRVKIVATSQMYSRVSKPIREQCFSVMVCRTWFGRLTTMREFEASKFATSGDSAYSLKKGVKPIWRQAFVQSNALRETYDTYEKIERLAKLDFQPRKEAAEE